MGYNGTRGVCGDFSREGQERNICIYNYIYVCVYIYKRCKVNIYFELTNIRLKKIPDPDLGGGDL